MSTQGGNESDAPKVLLYASETPLTEPVEPIEVDVFVQQNIQNIVKDPVGCLLEQALELPDVRSLPQTLGRTTASMPLELGGSNEMNANGAYLKDCISSYSKAFWTLQGKYSELHMVSLLKRTDRQTICSSLPVCEFESQTVSEISDTSRVRYGTGVGKVERVEETLPELRTQLSQADLDDVDAVNEEQRANCQLGRLIELARLVEPTSGQAGAIEYERLLCSPPLASEFSSVKLQLRFSELRLASFEPDFEPLFLSFAVYDLRERRKVSESFHFDFLTDAQRRALSNSNPNANRIDHSTTARACLVPLGNLHSDLFGVVRVEKVLQQGDAAELLETYERRGTDEAALERYRDAVADATTRLGSRFRMPLCWSAFELLGPVLGGSMDEAGDISTGPSDASLANNASYWQQGAELEAVVRSCRPATLRISKFFKQDPESTRDDALFRTLAELKKPAGARRQIKCIAAHLRVDMNPVDELDPDAYARNVPAAFPPPAANAGNNWSGPGKPGPPRVAPKPVPVSATKTAFYYLSPELKRLTKQFFDDLSRVQPIKMLAELASRPQLEPFTAYRNLLYVYPENVNFGSLRQGTIPSNARNIAVRVQLVQCGPEAAASAHSALSELANAAIRPLRAVFGKSSSAEMVDEMNTAVQWHNKIPEYYDEVKISLPAALNTSHVLLFTFLHVSCQRRKPATPSSPPSRPANPELSSVSPSEHLIGYSWLPLMTSGRLANGQFALPICAELPNAQQMRLIPDTHLTGLRWLDAHRPLFNVTLSPLSSVYTIDDYVATFFRRYDEAQLGRRDVVMREDLFESEFRRAIDGLLLASDEQLVRFLTLIFDRLLRVLLVKPPTTPGQRNEATGSSNISQTAFETIAKLVNKVKQLTGSRNDRFGRNEILMQYVAYLCTLPYGDLGLLSALSDASAIRRSGPAAGRLVHEQLVLHWLVSGASLRSLTVQNGWFFLELTMRSMHEYLVHTSALRQPRVARFAPQFLDDLIALVALLARHIADSLSELIEAGFGSIGDGSAEHAFVTVRNLNYALACFLVDLLAVLEWRFVFELVRHYVRVLTDKQCVLRTASDTTLFAVLKVDFLRAFVGYEHFLALNLPLFDHVLNYTQSLLLADGVPPQSATSLQGLLEFTDAYRQQHFILGLLFAELMLGLHGSASLSPGSPHRTNEQLVELLFNLVASHELDPRLMQPACLSRVVLLYAPLLRVVTDRLHLLYDPQVARRSAANFSSSTMRRKRTNRDSATTAVADALPKQLGERATKQLLLCILFVFRHTDRDLLRCWWGELSQQRLLKMLDCLIICANNFELPEKYSFNKASLLLQPQQQFLETAFDDSKAPAPTMRARRASAAFQSTRMARSTVSQKSETFSGEDSTTSMNATSNDMLALSNDATVNPSGHKSATMQRENRRGSMRRYGSSTSVNALTLVEIGDATTTEASITPRTVTQRSMSIVSNSAAQLAGDLLVTPGVGAANSVGKGSGSGVTAIVQQQHGGNNAAYSASPFGTLPRGFVPGSRTSTEEQPTRSAKLSLSHVFSNLSLSGSNNNSSTTNVNSNANVQAASSAGADSRREDMPDNNSVQYAPGGYAYASNPNLLLDGNLSTQVILDIVDILSLITQIVNCNLASMASFRLPLLRIYLHLLGLSLSTVAQQSVLAALQAFVRRYPDVVFDVDCAGVRTDMCAKLLRLAASRRAAVRQYAACCLCTLLRLSFEAAHAHFARFKSHLIIALSGFVPDLQNESRLEPLRYGLRKLLEFAEFTVSSGVTLMQSSVDIVKEGNSFSTQMRSLVTMLESVAADSCRLNVLANNHAMLVDTMHRIASAYRVAAPELRISWLQNIARRHLDTNQNAEAAQCYVHAAAIVSEYLMLRCSEPYLPNGAVAFENITPNVLEESAVSDDTVMPAELDDNAGPELTELTEMKLFTELSLAEFIDKAVNLFMQAGLYEMVGRLAHHLIPILEHHRSYRQLSALHARLHDAYQKAHQLAERRIYATYFRIAFFGSRLGDLDGCEYVQKEPALTKLAEISHRLEAETNALIEQQDNQTSNDAAASEKLSTPPRVEVIKDSNNVDRSKLDLANRVYVQVTYAEPYFEQFELLERRTAFERNYNVRRFVYATPFTMTGKPHGELGDQFKRKTILTVRHTFPFVTVRQPVIAREQIVLTPIEVACEDIEKKIAELGNALRTEPIDTKMLQMVLQGCIGTAVNQGPVELATVFLNDVACGRAEPTRFHCKLRILFKRFLKRSQDALVRNRDLITPEQKEYQFELERTYAKVKERIESLTGWTTPQADPPPEPNVRQSTYPAYINESAVTAQAPVEPPAARVYDNQRGGSIYCNVPASQQAYGNSAPLGRGAPKAAGFASNAPDSIYANQSQRSSVNDVYINETSADALAPNAILRKSVAKRSTK